MTLASVHCPSVAKHLQTSSPLKPMGQWNSNIILRLLRVSSCSNNHDGHHAQEYMLISIQCQKEMYGLGRVAQSVTCLATDRYLTADLGVASLIPAQSYTFVEIDHEIISTFILLPSAKSFKKDCRQFVHEVLVNCMFKLDSEKVWLGELTVPP